MSEIPAATRDTGGPDRNGIAVTDDAVSAWFLREILPLEALLMHYLRQNWRNASDIPDLRQEVYTRVFEAARERLPDHPRAFLLTTARNLLINTVRREQVVPMETFGDFEALNVAAEALELQTTLHAEPDVHYPTAPIGDFTHFKYLVPPVVFHDYGLNGDLKRSFHGAGPSLSWDASTPIAGASEDHELTLDWGLNGAVLFGRQAVRGHHQTTVKTYSRHRWYSRYPTRNAQHAHISSRPIDRARNVRVPDLGFTIGASYRYQNAKISFGYRGDVLFGAMDGGIDTYKSENRGFFGPYAKVSIGLGG